MADPSIPKPPPGAGRGGARLWREVLSVLELTPPETAQLREVVLTMGQLERLDQAARKSKAVLATPSGPRVHPAIVEARQQRIVLARLLAALRLPDDFDPSVANPGEGRPQHRGGARGPYAIAGGAS